MSYSIQILTNELETLKHSLNKSIKSYKSDKISLQVHNTHLRNLQPKIHELTIDINKLRL